MKKVLILGANGQIARFAIELFLKNTDFELTLFARNTNRLRDIASQSKRVHVVEGNVLDQKKLDETIQGHDVVYANLDADLPRQAKNIIAAMAKAKVNRLIFISSMGIYDEVPGQPYKRFLIPIEMQLY